MRLGDCFALLEELPDHSVDAFITDPPYGTTNASWDRQSLDLGRFWSIVRRKLKPSGIIVCFCASRFTFALYASNPSWYRYDLVWEKTRPCGFLNANRMPLRAHESILVFAPKNGGAAYYRPQKIPTGKRASGKMVWRRKTGRGSIYRGHERPYRVRDDGLQHPRSILRFDSVERHEALHPTQKPRDLIRWLIRSYTRPGALVCDPFMGSGTAAEACAIEHRRFFGCERDATYFRRATQRLIDQQRQQQKLASKV